MILTVDEVKGYLHIQGDGEDERIQQLISLAQAAIEDYCGATFEDDAPEPVKIAALLLVDHYYKNGDSPFDESMLSAFKNLLGPYCTKSRSLVLTVDEVKANLKEQYTEEDGLIETLIAQAQAAAEDYCRVKFDSGAPDAVKRAVLSMVSYYFEDRDFADPQSYKTMLSAFHNLLYPHRDVDKMF